MASGSGGGLDMLDPRTMEELRVIIQHVYQNIASIRTAFGDINRAAAETARTVTDGVGEFEAAWNTNQEMVLDSFTQIQARWTQFMDTARNDAQDLGSRLGRAFLGREDASGITGRVGGERGLTQMLHRAQGDIFSSLPMGGVIGLLLGGMKYELDAKAAGERAVQLFRRVGDTGRSEAVALGHTIKELGPLMPDIEQELTATIEGLASAGVARAEAFQRIGPDMLGGKLKGDVVQSLAFLDKEWNMGPGSAVNMATTMMKALGTNIGETTTFLRGLHDEVKRSGLSFTEYVGALNQAGNALRMQKQDMRDLNDVYQLVRQGADRTFVGASSQFKGAMAAEGFGALANAASTFSEGMKSVLAERLGSRFGVNFGGDALAPLFMFVDRFKSAVPQAGREGQVAQLQEHFLSNVVVEMKRMMAEEGALTKGEQFQYATKLFFNGNQQAGRQFIDIATKIDQGKEVSHDDAEALLSAISDSRSPIERLLEELALIVQQIGSAIIVSLVSLVRLLVHPLDGAEHEAIWKNFSGAWGKVVATAKDSSAATFQLAEPIMRAWTAGREPAAADARTPYRTGATPASAEKHAKDLGWPSAKTPTTGESFPLMLSNGQVLNVRAFNTLTIEGPPTPAESAEK